MADGLTPDDLERIYEEAKNWGRWGTDDQRGALNLITDKKRAEAARLVVDGTSVSCAQDFPTRPAADNPNPALHMMTAETHAPRYGAPQTGLT